MKPFNLTLQVTKNCNLQCKYCYELGHHRKEIPNLTEYLSALELFLKIFKKRNQKINLIYIGGEPSLNPDFIEKTLNVVYSTGLLNSVNIITNGILINNIIKSIEQSKIPEESVKELISIQISYDGKLINDKYRLANGNPTSDIVLRSIKKIKELCWNITLKSVLPVNEIHLVPEIIEEFIELGFKYQPTEDFSYLEHKLKESLTIEEYIKYFDEHFIKVLNIELERLDNNLQPISRWFLDYSLSKGISECQAGINSLSINERGMVQFCQQIDYTKILPKNQNDFNFYNIYDLPSMSQLETNLNNISNNFKCNLIESKRTQDYGCNDCSALFCVKCPLINYKYSNSTKNMYGQYIDEPFRCIYYKNLSKFLYTYDLIKDKDKDKG